MADTSALSLLKQVANVTSSESLLLQSTGQWLENKVASISEFLGYISEIDDDLTTERFETICTALGNDMVPIYNEAVHSTTYIKLVDVFKAIKAFELDDAKEEVLSVACYKVTGYDDPELAGNYLSYTFLTKCAESRNQILVVSETCKQAASVGLENIKDKITTILDTVKLRYGELTSSASNIVYSIVNSIQGNEENFSAKQFITMIKAYLFGDSSSVPSDGTVPDDWIASKTGVTVWTALGNVAKATTDAIQVVTNKAKNIISQAASKLIGEVDFASLKKLWTVTAGLTDSYKFVEGDTRFQGFSDVPAQFYITGDELKILLWTTSGFTTSFFNRVTHRDSDNIPTIYSESYTLIDLPFCRLAVRCNRSMLDMQTVTQDDFYSANTQFYINIYWIPVSTDYVQTKFGNGDPISVVSNYIVEYYLSEWDKNLQILGSMAAAFAGSQATLSHWNYVNKATDQLSAKLTYLNEIRVESGTLWSSFASFFANIAENGYTSYVNSDEPDMNMACDIATSQRLTSYYLALISMMNSTVFDLGLTVTDDQWSTLSAYADKIYEVFKMGYSKELSEDYVKWDITNPVAKETDMVATVSKKVTNLTLCQELACCTSPKVIRLRDVQYGLLARALVRYISIAIAVDAEDAYIPYSKNNAGPGKSVFSVLSDSEVAAYGTVVVTGAVTLTALVISSAVSLGLSRAAFAAKTKASALERSTTADILDKKTSAKSIKAIRKAQRRSNRLAAMSSATSTSTASAIDALNSQVQTSLKEATATILAASSGDATVTADAGLSGYSGFDDIIALIK